jgi:hypothetical protein
MTADGAISGTVGFKSYKYYAVNVTSTMYDLTVVLKMSDAADTNANADVYAKYVTDGTVSYPGVERFDFKAANTGDDEMHIFGNFHHGLATDATVFEMRGSGTRQCAQRDAKFDGPGILYIAVFGYSCVEAGTDFEDPGFDARTIDCDVGFSIEVERDGCVVENSATHALAYHECSGHGKCGAQDAGTCK